MVTKKFSNYLRAAHPAPPHPTLVLPSNCPALDAAASGRDFITTLEAATSINRAPQTLRKWACLENGPISPIRINGRLAWKVSDLRALLSGGS